MSETFPRNCRPSSVSVALDVVSDHVPTLGEQAFGPASEAGA